MSKEEILYQIKTYDSDVANIPDEWRMSIDNGKHYGRATQVYDFTKHRYIVVYVSDNYDIHTEIQTLLQENKQLKEELETLKDDFDFNLGAIENIRKGKNKLEQKIDKAVTRIKTIINIIKEQPTDNIHTDMYIIEALNSLVYILEEVKENE